MATSQPPYLAVRYTDGVGWRLFNSFPWTSASVLGLASSGDVSYQLGAAFGMFVYVEGVGSIALSNILDPVYSSWDLTDTYLLVMSRGGRLACTGVDTASGQGGIRLLSPLAFEDLGGAAAGSLGTPVLSGYGSLAPGDSTRVRLSSAAQNSLGVFVWSPSSTPLSLYGGLLYANPPSLFSSFQTDALGRSEVTFDWPLVSTGTPFYLQAGVFDSEAQGPVSLSNALRGVTQ